MTDPVRVGTVLESMSPRQRDLDAIEQAWETLAELLEAGTITEGQYAYVLRQEPDAGQDPLVYTVWAGMLRRYVRDPGGISANPEALRTWACRCGPGNGWVERPDGTWEPCGQCNWRQRERWVDHRLDPEHPDERASAHRKAPPSPEERRATTAEESAADLFDSLA